MNIGWQQATPQRPNPRSGSGRARRQIALRLAITGQRAVFALLAGLLIERPTAQATPSLSAALSVTPAGFTVVSGFGSAARPDAPGQGLIAHDKSPEHVAATTQVFNGIAVIHSPHGSDAFMLTPVGGSGFHPVGRDAASVRQSNPIGLSRNALPERPAGTDPSINGLIGLDTTGHFHRAASAGGSVFVGTFAMPGHASPPIANPDVDKASTSPAAPTASWPRLAKSDSPQSAMGTLPPPGASVLVSTGSARPGTSSSRSFDPDLSLAVFQSLLANTLDRDSAKERRNIETFMSGETTVSIPLTVIGTPGALSSSLTTFLDMHILP